MAIPPRAARCGPAVEPVSDSSTLRPAELLARRRAGVLLHPTSLPGPADHGDLGPPAHAFVDFLAAAGFSVWQVLPLGPVNASRSPYQTHSIAAGDPALISAELLVADGLVPAGISVSREQAWRRAWVAFRNRRPAGMIGEFEAFRERERGWLDDFALFMALREQHGRAAWTAWPVELRDRDAAALSRARRGLADPIGAHTFAQFLFARQWSALRAHAHARGVLLFGDLPVYPAHDSAEVWAGRSLFDLGADGRPRRVSGVPPDAFSADGQLWNTPVYAWDAARAELLDWWAARLRTDGERFDVVRIDHFRGLDAFWAIPADAPSAAAGAWYPAPGHELLARLEREPLCPGLVAEDLGVITPEVTALRRAFGLPGMRVLQFAFDGLPDNPHLPAAHEEDSVVYTGTHDNNTTIGWWGDVDEATRARVATVTGDFREPMPWPLVDLALGSIARLAMLPMQDCLALGSAARMNRPATSDGNWRWRMMPGTAGGALAAELRARLQRAGRAG
ncbi:MAG: 4-alpha-glucanotransferase [Gammaproteobacteria bacterium]|nr:MAG: 4-alpha-glucanotransferase [Gammaproteobacteria bacterium]